MGYAKIPLDMLTMTILCAMFFVYSLNPIAMLFHVGVLTGI
jgi:hypothetical protein